MLCNEHVALLPAAPHPAAALLPDKKTCGYPGTNVDRSLFVPGLPHTLLDYHIPFACRPIASCRPAAVLSDLFPSLNHVHYPRIAKVVQQCCKDFDIPYAPRPTSPQLLVLGFGQAQGAFPSFPCS